MLSVQNSFHQAFTGGWLKKHQGPLTPKKANLQSKTVLQTAYHIIIMNVVREFLIKTLRPV